MTPVCPAGVPGVCSLLSSTLHSASHTRPPLETMDSPDIMKRYRHAAKLKMGDPKDDIHVCIMCLRAIMNNKVSARSRNC